MANWRRRQQAFIKYLLCTCGTQGTQGGAGGVPALLVPSIGQSRLIIPDQNTSMMLARFPPNQLVPAA